MEQGARKATDVILSLESKIDMLVNLYKSQDYNIKILSNKLNLLLDQLAKMSVNTTPSQQIAPQIIIEAADVAIPQNKQIKINSENSIQITNDPVGQRRTSRSDDFEEIGRKNRAEAIKKVADQFKEVEKQESPKPATTTKNVQVTQRIVDKSNNSIFLAEVEVKNISDDTTVHKTRTNGVGKWVGTLPLGKYRVTIRKRQSTGKSLEVSQDIDISAGLSPMELPDLIVK